MKKFAVRTLPFVVAMALALYMLPGLLNLAKYRDTQTYLYDQAIQMMQSDNPEEAAQAPQAFVQSYKTFQGNQPKTWSDRHLLPKGDQEMAALALFHIGNILRLQGQNKEALGAYVESLRLNAGQRMLQGVSARDDGSHQYGRDFCVAFGDKVGLARPVTGDDCQLLRLEKQADDTRNNLLSLLSEHPELASMLENPGAMGAPGQGQPGSGNGQPVMPSDSKGHSDGNNDAI